MLAEPHDAALDHGHLVHVVRTQRRQFHAYRAVKAGRGEDPDQLVQIGDALTEPTGLVAVAPYDVPAGDWTDVYEVHADDLTVLKG